MKVINRKSIEIVLNGGRATTRKYIVIEKRRIYFTAAITRLCELKTGLYVHFLNEGSDWDFYVNDDPDGFKLTPVVSKGGFHINNTGLTTMILKSTGFNKAKRFAVVKTDLFQDRSPVFKLSLENVSTVKM